MPYYAVLWEIWINRKIKDIAFIYNKRVIKFDYRPITDKYYNSVSEFCNGFAEFCQQYCTTLTMVLQNFVIS